MPHQVRAMGRWGIYKEIPSASLLFTFLFLPCPSPLVSFAAPSLPLSSISPLALDPQLSSPSPSPLQNRYRKLQKFMEFGPVAAGSTKPMSFIKI